jgi:shikimate kinase
MGSGKTTVGQMISWKLGYSFIDLDSMIEEKYKITIASFFSKFDEKVFRKVENETLKDTILMKDTVVSTGGGTPCYFDNMEIINKSGISVYLKTSTNTLHQRLLTSKKKRPLLAGKTSPAIMDHIMTQLAIREPYYLRSMIITDGNSLDVDELIKTIFNFTKKSN